LTVAFFAIFFLSLLFSFVLTRYVRDFASRRGWVAVPSQERHLHSSPLPRLGGVAIFLSFSLGMLAAALMASYIPYLHSAVSLKTLLTILAPASLVFLLGVYDDLYTAGPYIKFAVQALAATMLFPDQRGFGRRQLLQAGLDSIGLGVINAAVVDQRVGASPQGDQ